MSISQLPPNLKAIQHYLKTATEHDKRDPVVSYYCRLYAVQKGMEIDKKSPDCRTFLVGLMDYIEKQKTASSEEAIHSEVVGQAHLENYALKVFLFADNEDRAGRFNKNVVKSFYTAGMLFDVLGVFGEINEDIEKNRKYAKWKAAYIHKCLKSGETPVAGPLPEDDDESVPQPSQPSSSGGMMPPDPTSYGGQQPYGGQGQQPYGGQGQQPYGGQQPYNNLDLPAPGSQRPTAGAHAPPPTPQSPPQASQPSRPPVQQPTWEPPSNPSGVKLKTEDYQRAMKLCKFASSALQYEDPSTAIDNLTKALKLLTTGNENS